MDSLEEVPIADVGDTYLTAEQLNKKYPVDTIDVSDNPYITCAH